MSAFYDAVMSGLKSRKRAHIGLRMTPMVDIIFLLLTFFVLTAKFQDVEKSLNIFLPKDRNTAEIEQKPLIINLTSQNGLTQIQIPDSPSLSLSGNVQDEEMVLLTQALTEVMSIPYQAIEINCDDGVVWDHIVKVYDMVYAMGGENITFRYQE